MQTIEGFDFFPLTFDRDGQLVSSSELHDLLATIGTAGATDAIFLAHGFRNSEREATMLYTNFLRNLRVDCGRDDLRDSLGGRRIAVAGVFWPSKPFREVADLGEGGAQALGDELALRARVRAQLEQLRDEDAPPDRRPALDRAIELLPSLEQDPAAQDEFVSLVLSVLSGADGDKTEGLEQIRAQPGSELLGKLRVPIILPTSRDDDDEGGVAAAGRANLGGGRVLAAGDVLRSVQGRVGQFLNLTTWYVMKERAGTVGAQGVAAALRQLKARHPGVKIHLVGHSLGARLMAAAVKALGSAPPLQPDSLMLLEGAFSHYGFSANNGHGVAGFFRDVVAQQIVKGPVVSTFSVQDTVVGYAYAIMSRLAGDNVKAVGDANDPFGGIGRNGTQKTQEAVNDVLHAPGVPYDLKLRVINNLDGSGGLIKDHGDVTNPVVTYAFASAMART
jgi:hypothetical protein